MTVMVAACAVLRASTSGAVNKSTCFSGVFILLSFFEKNMPDSFVSATLPPSVRKNKRFCCLSR
jgi:hypothetical protein